MHLFYDQIRMLTNRYVELVLNNSLMWCVCCGVEVLEIVRGNYDSLTLKMHDSLDQFERYSEKPKETTFFSHLVSHSLYDVKSRGFGGVLRELIFLLRMYGEIV